MTTSESYSETWRINKSHIKYLELAQALRGLRKVIGTIDPEGFSISFAQNPDDVSYCDTAHSRIVIDPKFALKSTPISGPDFDILVGLSAHEAAHALLESLKAKPITAATNQLLHGIYTVGEEVYVDSYLRRVVPIVGKYLTKARQAYNVEPDTVDWPDLIEAWKAIAVYGHTPPVEAFGDDKVRAVEISVLMELSQTLMNKTLSWGQRRTLYESIANTLEELARRAKVEESIRQRAEHKPPLDLESNNTVSQQLPSDKKEEEQQPDVGDDNASNDEGEESDTDENDTQPQGSSGSKDGDTSTENGTGSGQGDDNQNGEASGESSIPTVTIPMTKPIELHPTPGLMNPELHQAVQEALDNETEDITISLQSIYNNDLEAGTIIWEQATTEVDSEFSPELALQLRWIQEYKNTVGHQVYRNEARGTIDQTRLHRAPITGKVFKTKQIIPHQDLGLVLLVDASSSMNNGKNLTIYEDVKALFKSLPEAKVISYREDRGLIKLALHTSGRQFRKIHATGNTPSGVALAAVANKYPNSLIIHFTDGGPNRGVMPEEIMPEIHEQYPKVKIVNIRLDISLNNRGRYHYDSSMDEVYPIIPGVSSNIEISNVNEFPQALKEVLLRW
tara:strand:+ start:2744 stop:4603 length:1860 start_codon:yes stop_codon:yes gene_type:complete